MHFLGKGCVAMKFLKITLILLLCLSLLAGCSAKGEQPSTLEIAQQLKSYSADTVSWAELNKTKISAYFGFADDNIEEFKGYVNDSEEYFDIIAVFKLKNPDTKDEVIKGISFMSKTANNIYRITNKSVSDKINSRIIAEKDDLIILCIMDNYGQISKYLTDVLKAKIIS